MAAVTALAVPLSACTSSSGGGGGGQHGSGPYGTLNVGLETLGAFACAPRLTSSADAGRSLVMSGAYDTLVRLNAQGKYVADLATSWSVDKAGTTWTFQLRHGVQFDMGYGEMTSADVVYSLEQAAAKGSLNGNAGSLDSLFKKITAVGKYTVQIYTGTPQSDMLAFLRNDIAGAAYIVSEKQAQKIGVNATDKVGCAGTGPWQFVQAKSDQYWKFKAVKTNWQQTPAFQYLTLWEVPEEATRVAEFQSGQLDIILADPDSIQTVKGSPGTQLATTPSGVDFHLGFYGNYYVVKRPGYDPSLPYVSANPNPNSAAWKRAVKVREAMSIAIDRQSIVKNLLHGDGQATALWGWGATEKYLPANVKWNYSPAEAKKLLAQAGYPHGFPVTLNIRIAGAPAEVQACQAIAEMWTNIGLKVKFENQPNDAILPSLLDRSQNGIVCQAVGDVPEPIDQYVDWEVSTAPFSGGVEDPVLDHLITQAAGTLAFTARMKIEQQIAEFNFKNALDAGVYRAEVQWPVGPNVGNVAEWVSHMDFGDGRILSGLNYVEHSS